MKYLRIFFIFAVFIFIIGPKIGYCTTHPKQTHEEPEWSNEWVDRKFLNITADQSKHLIVDALKEYFENETVFLEISSGNSRYVTCFAQNFPYVTFKLAHYKRLDRKRVEFSNLANVEKPIYFDITSSPRSWFRGEIRTNKTDYIFTTTMVNNVPMKNTSELFFAAALYLKPDAVLFMYGIFKMNGKIPCEEASEIDKELRKKNYLLGIREVTLELTQQAYVYGLFLEMVYELPNCHQILVWRKDEIGIRMNK